MTGSSLKKFLSPPLLLLVATLAVYAVTGSFSLLNTWDDADYLGAKDTVKALTLPHIREAFTSYYVGNWAPVHILSYMVDHALWGLNPAGYHLENVILHALNGILFYLLLRRLELGRNLSLAASWIFLFHPVQVESVAWVSQRKNLLAMLFFLIAFIAYQSYRTRQVSPHIPYLASLASFSAALLSKSIAVIFPVAILVFDHAYPQRTSGSRTRWYWKVPFFLAAVAAAAMAIESQSYENRGGRAGYPGGTPYSTFLTMVPVLVGYVRDCLWPSGLSPFYMTKIRMQPDLLFWFSASILLLLVAAGWYLYRRHRSMFFWYGFFFLALLPVMQIVPLVTLKNDRYLYFPMIGFAVLAVMGGDWLYRRLHQTTLRLFKVAVMGILMILPLLALKQTLYWQDDVTLWSRSIEVDPENRLGWRLLAMGYTKKGEAEKAAFALKRMLELHEMYGPVHGYEEDL